jgi:hypothetical protein
MREKLAARVVLRVPETDRRRAWSLADKMPVTPAEVLRAALRLGLAALEGQPALMLEAAPTARRRRG